MKHLNNLFSLVGLTLITGACTPIAPSIEKTPIDEFLPQDDLVQAPFVIPAHISQNFETAVIMDSQLGEISSEDIAGTIALTPEQQVAFKQNGTTRIHQAGDRTNFPVQAILMVNLTENELAEKVGQFKAEPIPHPTEAAWSLSVSADTDTEVSQSVRAHLTGIKLSYTAHKFSEPQPTPTPAPAPAPSGQSNGQTESESSEEVSGGSDLTGEVDSTEAEAVSGGSDIDGQESTEQNSEDQIDEIESKIKNERSGPSAEVETPRTDADLPVDQAIGDEDKTAGGSETGNGQPNR